MSPSLEPVDVDQDPKLSRFIEVLATLLARSWIERQRSAPLLRSSPSGTICRDAAESAVAPRDQSISSAHQGVKLPKRTPRSPGETEAGS